MNLDRHFCLVIASEAKQSRSSIPVCGLLRRFAPRNDKAVNQPEFIPL